jgi:hypothetical protein
VGDTTAETVRDIAATRQRLDAELRELETYLPAAAVWAKRIAGMLAGGGVGSWILWSLIRRRRRGAEGRRLRDIERRLRVLEANL